MAFVPTLLMLATIGLGRLETWLGHDTVTATDVAEFLQQAQGQDMRTLAHEGMPRALDYRHHRQRQAVSAAPVAGLYTGKHHAVPFLTAVLSEATELGLPTRVGKHSQLSPSVTPTRHVNRV